MDRTVGVKDLHERIGHPVIDADGHLVESMRAFSHYLERVGGHEQMKRYIIELKERPVVSRGDAYRGEPRGAWWGVSNDAYDVATVMVPRLLHRRMEEIGIDFAVLYPTLGLRMATIQNADIRATVCAAMNLMNAELCGPYSDRLAPAAVIPTHTPAEALAELEHARQLGFRVAMFPPGVARPIPALEKEYPDAFPYAARFDCYGIDSLYDYDPVWAKCAELKFAVTFHGAVGGLRYMPSGARSPSSYMYNHLGGHAYQQGEVCRSLILGGVPTRFPQLTFAFLECGVGWACDLLHGLVEHWEKRNPEGLRNYDPALLDRPGLEQYLREFGGQVFATEMDSEFARLMAGDSARYGEDTAGGRDHRGGLDEFSRCGVREEADFARIFENLYFGCEADDPSVCRAFASRFNELGVTLKPVFSSDIGHWDVPDIKQVLRESHRLVDKGMLSESNYRDFVFSNPARLHLKVNPDFFAKTVVARETAAV
jgi:predicted TIM-barrel fold metal-dependent hydrolase